MPFAMPQNSVDNVTITKLGGAGNIVEITRPPQMLTRHSTMAITMALNGESVMIMDVAAGVTTSAKMSSVPTAGTAMVITQ